MDTTFVFNQVKVPTGINTVVENMPSLPDSIHVSIDNLVNVAQESVEPVTIWGLTLDWGAIIIPTVASLIVFDPKFLNIRLLMSVKLYLQN